MGNRVEHDSPGEWFYNKTRTMLGCCVPRDPSKHTNKLINEALERDRKALNAESKLLLLGAGESGKSTVVKQMKIIFTENGYSTEECLDFKPVIFSNTIQSMLAILQAMARLNISFADSTREKDAALILNYTELETTNHDVLPENISKAMQVLWADDGVQKCFLRAREYYLNDSAAYYLNSLDRLTQADYIPTQQDVLRTRVKTTGVVETAFTLKNHRFRIVDVGGQRSERKKWIRCFEDVTAVIFVSALNEYDLVLAEDNSVNRMHESIQLFKSICNNRFFQHAGMILFLNKKDLFAEKLRFSPIGTYFSDYNGPNTYECSLHYIQEQFEKMDLREKNHGHQRDLYVHITCATDTETMQFVFAAISDMIIQSNFMHAGIF
ncbi:unnamed protein product [Adineta ricciae]|uniref:Uncharacterized protein n=1 Tax=Adineta ricciae TaxID=249248 RepID=A0A814LMA2_ADIRI|nr:unnamed protein product [Adineta ricciae]CAF1066141.1 unnamed protein product [Adineta ricciae]